MITALEEAEVNLAACLQALYPYWVLNKIAGGLLFVTTLGAYMATVGTLLCNASKRSGRASCRQSLMQTRSCRNIRVAAMCRCHEG